MYTYKKFLPVVLAGCGLAGFSGGAQAARSCFGVEPTVVGTNRSDTIEVRETAPDVYELFLNDESQGTYDPAIGMVVAARSGDDVIVGGPGDDLLCGDNGRDRIQGGGGDDRTDGGNGRDYLEGGDGNDEIYGGNGRDELYGDDPEHSCVPSPGDEPSGEPPLSCDDSIDGGNGRDYAEGGNGNDELRGGRGRDTLYGDDPAGSCEDDPDFGPYCDDVMDGEKGRDELHGGPGSDTLDGGQGQDTCTYSLTPGVGDDQSEQDEIDGDDDGPGNSNRDDDGCEIED